MHADSAPEDEAAWPDADGPPLQAHLTLTRLEDTVERLQQTETEQGHIPLGEVLRVTTDAMTLAQGLLRGWQAQQAETQAGLTTWRQHTQTLETTGVLLQIQTETLRQATGQLRRAPWWAFLAGVGLMGLVALGAGHLTAPPHLVPPGPSLRSLPMLPESLRPSEEPFRTMPDATPVPATDDTPTDEGP